MANMSTQWHPLGELPLNIIRGKELTPKMRGKILGMHEANHNEAYIMVRLNGPDAPYDTLSHKTNCAPIARLYYAPVKRSPLYLSTNEISFGTHANTPNTYTPSSRRIQASLAPIKLSLGSSSLIVYSISVMRGVRTHKECSEEEVRVVQVTAQLDSRRVGAYHVE
jgi:hypothetical protein